MFDNIGEKMKSWAEAIFWVFSVADVICGLALLKTPIWLIPLIGGPLTSWILSMVLYGFGELIENQKRTAERIEALDKNVSSFISQQTEKEYNEKGETRKSEKAETEHHNKPDYKPGEQPYYF